MTEAHRELNTKIKELSKNMRKASTKEEVILWRCLRKHQTGYMFRRQFVVDNKYIVDFACLEKRLVIELDGSQHCDSEDDKVRDNYLESQGFVILRFWNNDILQNLEGCLGKIKQELEC